MKESFDFYLNNFFPYFKVNLKEKYILNSKSFGFIFPFVRFKKEISWKVCNIICFKLFGLKFSSLCFEQEIILNYKVIRTKEINKIY